MKLSSPHSYELHAAAAMVVSRTTKTTGKKNYFKTDDYCALMCPWLGSRALRTEAARDRIDLVATIVVANRYHKHLGDKMHKRIGARCEMTVLNACYIVVVDPLFVFFEFL